ncbi:SCAN domain-containing protein 3, partial [Habropoda laboriosa]
KKQKILERKYNEDYIRYGFSCCDKETPPKPECIICGEMLSNEAMVPSKLLRHLNSNHRSYAKKDKSFFLRQLDQRRKQRQSLLSSVTVSDKALEASYHVARLIARQKKPHTIGETLVKPACIEIVKSMLGPREVNEVKKVPLSADTVKKRINDMLSDILGILIAKLKTAQKFALQIDEPTDIKNRAQLIAIVRFVDEGTITIKEHYLFCNELPERTTDGKISRVTDDFFKTYDIPWSNCTSICTDGAAAMMANKNRFYWMAKLAYIFEHINQLNKKMQGRSENYLTCSDKLMGFKNKLELWQKELQKGSLEMFQRTYKSMIKNKQLILDLTQPHLSLLQEKLNHYFFTINTEQYNWIRNSFLADAENSTEALSLQIREEFIELRNDGTLKLNFSEMPLADFWISVKKEYPQISVKVVPILLPFSTTYLCEQSFSTLVLIKNDKRSCL